jgi:DNA mismatch repair protein MutS
MSEETKQIGKQTPIRRQYLEIKRQYPNAIVFFRLGDFYETFDEDAEITSRELDIVLTSRNVAKGSRIPMAGIPYHAAENYLSRLIEKGHHVAICEQMGSTQVKGLVPRKVVRVITPGTIVEPGLLSGGRNNYLACVLIHDTKAGFAYVDITTGEFSVCEIASEALSLTTENVVHLTRGEATRLHPSEILVPDNQENLIFNNQIPDSRQSHITPLPTWKFEFSRCQDSLMKHFQVSSLNGFGLRGKPLAIKAAGTIIQYLQETQSASLILLSNLYTYTLNDFMTLDAATRRNLELTETLRYSAETSSGSFPEGSLLSVLDKTVTPMGKRLIRNWVSKPLLDIQNINTRQNSISALIEYGLLRTELRTALRSMSDLERLTNRVISMHAGPRDLTAIRNTLQDLPKIKELLQNNKEDFSAYTETIDLCKNELSLLNSSINDEPPATLQHTGIIRPGFSAELDIVVDSSQHARDWIANLESIERERTGIKTLKVGYNKVFGYYIEITRTNADLAPEEYIRKQTLVNAERYITPEMKEYETLVINSEERIRDIENRIFTEICVQISSAGRALLDTAHSIAQLDVLASLAETAALNGYVRPEVTNDNRIDILDGRHPVVEISTIPSNLKAGATRFVPNDCQFNQDEIVRIITGPNMSGKSTFLRQVALIVLMAQMGSYVPAESAKIGLVDRIFTRIGAQDEIHAGQSTFMVEMTETANILHHATSRSLLILDEIGRGTSTYDGVSIAWAVIEHIHIHPNIKARTLFATHYHELTQLSDILPGVNNFNVAVSDSDGKVVFLHKIVPGSADRSYGIHVAQLAGIPRSAVQRAAEILKQLEETSGNAVRIESTTSQQMTLFPETNPLLKELKTMDLNTISPIEALNKLFEWRMKYEDE